MVVAFDLTELWSEGSVHCIRIHFPPLASAMCVSTQYVLAVLLPPQPRSSPLASEAEVS